MTLSKELNNADLPFLQGGGEMGVLIRSIDWSLTPIGHPAAWPSALKITAGVLLSSPFPMYIAWGKEYIQLYNDGYRPILGATKHPHAMGISSSKTFPEIWHIVGPMFDEVMHGKPTWAPDFMYVLERNGFPEECYFDFSYSPIKDETGDIGGILVTVIETTEKVKAFNDTKIAQQNLENSQAETAQQRDRLNQFLMQAPAGICVLDGPELVFELINPRYRQLFPGRDLLGKPIREALPEIKGQPIWEVLQDVYNTGKTFEGNELLIPLARTTDGPVEDRYFNFIYQARRNSAGQVDGILVFVFEVTEMVLAATELLKTKDNLKMATTSAQLGTFDMDLKKGTMDWDERCRTLFGISHQDTVSYEKDFLPGLHPDDRERVEKLINNVFIKSISNGDYDVEYRTVGAEDNELRWVRAMGKAYFDEQDKPVRFVGSVMDITERKLDELRKNDFIGMVSHELKTPLTTLTSIIQIGQAKLKNSEDKFLAGAMEKANRQVKKMSSMINGFLNISRLESGKILVVKQAFDLGQLAKEMIDETEMIISSHHIQFEPCAPIIVNADREKIGSVISNLLSNAVKYSPKGKTITVKCEVIENNVVFMVKDEGMGIMPRDKEKLFERYYRVESNQTQHVSGFGIGLYLSAEIIQHHRGKIWVDSEIGAGSTFYFSLPLN